MTEQQPYAQSLETGSFASYATRNPLLPTIQPVQRIREKHDKLTTEVARAARAKKQDEFLVDIRVYNQEQKKVIDALADKYHKQPEYMENLILNRSLYKKSRRSNIWNAKSWKKREELNAGKDHGDRASLQEIHNAVKKDPKLANLTKEEHDTLIQEFEEAKCKRRMGVRINNRAATLDYQYTVQRIDGELKALNHRTGASAIGIFSRSHVNDSMQPEWVSSATDTLTFLPETMHITPGEMMRKFELWSVTKGDNKAQNELVRLRTECAEMIVQRLRELVGPGRRNIRMSYQYYNVDIRNRWKVELKGWPAGVEFKAPGTIMTMHEIRTLHKALLTGECHWKAMSQKDIDELAKKLTEEPVVKTRQPKKRKNNENAEPTVSTEESQPRLKRKRKQKTVPKSLPTVNDEE